MNCKRFNNIMHWMAGMMLVLAAVWPSLDVRAGEPAAEASVEKAEASVEKSVTEGEEKSEEEGEVDVQEIIFGHIGDSYEWHITDLGDTRVAIPLPIIVYSSRHGFNVFSSERLLEEEGSEYNGFHISAEGDLKGKVVERDEQGNEVRPVLDISLTKVSASILLNCFLLGLIIVGVARWYKGRDVSAPAPGGFVGFMEMFIVMIYEDVIKSCVGPEYKRYAPFLLTCFFFIFLSNLMGLIPIFPAGANVTGNIAVTFFLAVCTFLAVNLFGNREYWKEILWPEVPTWLKCPVPLMPAIELFGIFTKPFALMVRLFANIMAGHAVILAMICIIFITAKMGAMLNGPLTVVSVAFAIFMNCLELLVAFIQAYVFTMLSAVFIGLSRPQHEGHQEKK